MVLLTRIELVIALYQSAGMPLTYKSVAEGIGIEPIIAESKSTVIPFN